MASELAIIDILRDDATVAGLIGGSGTKARVYPYEMPQKAVYPCVVVSMEDIEPSDTKSGASALDVEYIKVECIDIKFKNSAESSGAYHIAEAVRSALDRTSGTYSAIVCQSIRFLSKSGYMAEINNNILYIQEQTYKVRVKR